ncbi:class I SAM-dependent RNA methyltransferase [Sphingomicrobium nitratireducens]|uniref:class I SAM-dependent RNA methyltransferase n=1 Tax=Sphingomicrobium nitratireducens TaxID=2964666 RepID=UPI00223EC3BD
MSEEIVRIAARGDGVTPSGAHVPLAAPGDLVEDGRVVREGPHHAAAPCRHYPQCGGCQLQHLSEDALTAYCTDRVAGALAHHGLETDLRPGHLSPPNSRRRASLKAMKAGGRVMIGFNEERSHRIVDMAECHILAPDLFALVVPLRRLLGVLLPKGRTAQVQMTLADQGVDVMLSGVATEGLEAVEAVSEFAERHKLARLSIDEGYGAEDRWAPQPVTVTLSGIPVALPSGAFLQATRDGEDALVAAALEATAGEGPVLDLFAGLGTFAFAMASRGRDVVAAEAGRDAILSLKGAASRAGLPVEASHRDLYRNPVQSDELARFAAIVLDPPRAGAEAQVGEIARSKVARISYVSCNPATFAKDALTLVDGGYSLDWVRPVGQFRWSTHVELAAAFSR